MGTVRDATGFPPDGSPHGEKRPFNNVRFFSNKNQ